LAARFHVGWDQEHPVTKEELAAVRTAVHAQWKNKQPDSQATDASILEVFGKTPVAEPKLANWPSPAIPSTENQTGAKAPKPFHSPEKKSKSAKKVIGINVDAHPPKSQPK
jgi:hypothetical protein